MCHSFWDGNIPPIRSPIHPSFDRQYSNKQRLGLEATAEGEAALAPWREKMDEGYLEELGAALEAKAQEVRIRMSSSRSAVVRCASSHHSFISFFSIKFSHHHQRQTTGAADAGTRHV